ncbi:MAG: hypothetical protein ACR2MM_06440 [Flavobacteriaceae bacterium]
MLWIALILLLVGLLVYLLYLPIDIVISTSGNQYYARIGVLGRARVEADDNYILRIQLKTMFLRFYYYPLKKRVKKKKARKAVAKRYKFKWAHLNIAIRVIKSFDVKRFVLDMDTGNCITNAKLFPLFAFLNYSSGDTPVNYSINFSDNNRLDMHIQNRPIRIIKSFINPKKLYHGITF